MLQINLVIEEASFKVNKVYAIRYLRAFLDKDLRSAKAIVDEASKGTIVVPMINFLPDLADISIFYKGMVDAGYKVRWKLKSY